jgi:hypothetical protein
LADMDGGHELRQDRQVIPLMADMDGGHETPVYDGITPMSAMSAISLRVRVRTRR